MQKFKCKVCGYVYDPAINDNITFENLPEDWKCPVCGAPKSEFEIIHVKGEPQTGGEAQEKHVPVISGGETGATVTVGAVEHPMTLEHHIVWIELRDGEKVLKKIELKVGEKPVAKFEGIAFTPTLKAFAFCNLHGVWES